MSDQVKVKCGDCGFEFMSGALPENRRCKNQNPVCNSANISVVETEQTSGGECDRCPELEKKINDLEKANAKLQDELIAERDKAPAEMTIKDIVFTLDREDPFGKGLPMMIGKATPNGREMLEKYIQRAVGSMEEDRADVARAALDKMPKAKKK